MLSVIVLNWNREAATRKCLRRLAGWKRLDPEIWLVDNGSKGGEAGRLALEFPGVKCLASDVNLGFGGGNNLALRRASGNHILLLNNDAKISEGDVEPLIQALNEHLDILAVGPTVVDRDGDRKTSTAGGRDVVWNVATHWRADALPETARIEEDLFEVDYVPGAAVLLRATAVRELDYLDEDYFFGGELADICERGRRKGLRAAVLTTATAEHDLETASKWRAELYPYYILRNRFVFARKVRSRLLVVLIPLWTAYGVLSILRAAVEGRLRRARILTMALVDGLAGRHGDGSARVLGARNREPVSD